MVVHMYSFRIQEVEDGKSHVQSCHHILTLCELGMDDMRSYLKITNK